MSSTATAVIASCGRSLFDWRNEINKYSVCQCRANWVYIRSVVAQSDAEAAKYKDIINKNTGNRDVHIISCGHVWYGVK
jgi:hypothetical protein